MSNTTNEPQINQVKVAGLICVTLDVHLWSGRKRLRKDALISRNPEFAKLPPESLATLGAIKICDPSDLKPFQKLKRHAETLIMGNGLPCFGTFGIPEKRLPDIFSELVRIQSEFEAHALSFKARFERAIENWKNTPANAEWAGLIQDIPTAEHVAGKLSFRFQLYQPNPPTGDVDSEANVLYAKQMTGLKGELFADAATEAEVLMTKYLTGRDAFGVVSRREQVTWKTLRPLKRIAEKFRSFGFLDPTVEPLADLIDHSLALLPPEGPIEGIHLMHIWAIAKALNNPQRAMEVALLASQNDDTAVTFSAVLAQQKQVQPADAEPEQKSQGPESEQSVDNLIHVQSSGQKTEVQERVPANAQSTELDDVIPDESVLQSNGSMFGFDSPFF